tara:strand:+ start:228 stop:1178 length:951 start_codon:yes stop_codon:yes gene_type:complete
MIEEKYLYSSTYPSIDDFVPKADSIYIYAHSTEGRSHSVDRLIEQKLMGVKFVEVSESPEDKILEVKSNLVYSLRSSKSIHQFFESHGGGEVYIDVSGMGNRVSASLINNAVQIWKSNPAREIHVIYTEPETYNIKGFQSEGVFHDLSEQIDGIEPLPGFATIIPDEVDDFEFIALLGFEGGRFTHMIESVQPPKDNIIPVIGVPGFRLEYPFVAYWGNRRPLKETETWRNVRYAAANSIVDTYFLLSKLLRSCQSNKMKVAPIGTKPHAIGAIIFAIQHSSRVELVYDNPVRKKKRTEGLGKIVVCNVSSLLAAN